MVWGSNGAGGHGADVVVVVVVIVNGEHESHSIKIIE